MKARILLAACLATLLLCCWTGRQNEGFAAAPEILPLRVFYAGHPGTSREADFAEFLQKHVVKVGKGDLAKFSGKQADGFDVVILDYDGDGFGSPRPPLPRSYARPTITVGVTGAQIGGNLGLKTGYL
jgi:hypothetical protein